MTLQDVLVAANALDNDDAVFEAGKRNALPDDHPIRTYLRTYFAWVEGR